MPDNTFALAVGARLRAIRIQQGLSLQGVEQKSRGRWKPAAVGSYERGDRMISVRQLSELADFYGVPVSALLDDGRGGLPGAVRIALEGLAAAPEDAATLRRWVATVQGWRGDYNGRVITLRGGDLDALAAAHDVAPDDLLEWMRAWGVLDGGGTNRAAVA